MTSRSVRLPPLNAMRAFWSVMRQGSFRAAADELSVSPQAVSQQIRILEDALAVRLFERKGHAIAPTEQAILLSHFVQAGFDEFAEGVRRVTGAARRNRININVSPYFATRFLIQRLGRFHDRMPSADLRLTTRVEMPDFSLDEVDVSIQWGFGTWSEYETTLLVRDPKIICCAPSLAARIRTPEDLAAATLLHPVIAPTLWEWVLRHLGQRAGRTAGGIELHDAETMKRAVISGIGVGLVSRADALDDLQAGRLVAPLGIDVLSDMDSAEIPGFYLVVPRGHKRLEAVKAFCDWVNSEAWDYYA